jgi:hydroxymethylglutaryl-CoA synthase
MDYDKSLTDKTLEKTFMALTKKRFQDRVAPSIQIATMCGNLYCGSIWSSIASLMAHVDSTALDGKRIGVFSYGSGLAASFMSFRVKGSVADMAQKLDIPARLQSRRAVPPEVYDAVSPTNLPSTYSVTNALEDVRTSQEGSPAKGLQA